MTTAEYEAVQSLNRGEESGFNFFFNLFYKRLLSFAFNITKNNLVAEEIVSDSFLKMWKSRLTLNHPSVIKSWMFTTVKNGCLNWLHNEKIKKRKVAVFKRSVEEEFEESIESMIIRQELHALEKEFQKSVIKRIQDLPKGCRKIMELLYVDGLNFQQIADKLSLSVSTVKTQKANGLLRIQKKMKSDEKELTQVYSVEAPLKNIKPPEESGIENRNIYDWGKLVELYKKHFYKLFAVGWHIPIAKMNQIVYDSVNEVSSKRVNYGSIAECKREIQRVMEIRVAKSYTK